MGARDGRRKKSGSFSRLDPADRDELIAIINKQVQDAVRSDVLLKNLVAESNLSEATNLTLGKLVQKTGLDPEEALLYALTLCDVATDAVAEGLRLVLLINDYKFVREVGGLAFKATEASIPKTAVG